MRETLQAAFQARDEVENFRKIAIKSALQKLEESEDMRAARARFGAAMTAILPEWLDLLAAGDAEALALVFPMSPEELAAVADVEWPARR